MEDDLFHKKEDDLGEKGAMEDIRVSQEPIETNKEDRKAPEVPVSTQEIQEDSLSTPLLNKELEEASTRDGFEDKPTILDVASSSTIRANPNPAVTENNQKIEDNPFERRQPRDITVNGISLMSIMNNKRKESIKNTPKGTKNDKRTKNKPGTATPPVAKITKYFEMIGRENIENNEDRRRKTSTTKDIDVDNSDSIADNNSEDDNTGSNEEFGRVNYEENNKKKTFSEVSRSMKMMIMKEKIRNFEVFQNGGGSNECVMSGGRCVKHKVRLTREVTARRVSNINQLGEVTWQRREGIILVCPLAGQQSSSDDIKQPVRGATTNKKIRITDSGSDEQITASNTVDEELLLDSEYSQLDELN